jgi:hypothetical protein
MRGAEGVTVGRRFLVGIAVLQCKHGDQHRRRLIEIKVTVEVDGVSNGAEAQDH